MENSGQQRKRGVNKMEHVPLIIGLISAAPIFLIGIAIKYFKAYWLISGYNTMSKSKKKNVDIKSLGNFVGNIAIVIGGIIVLASALMSARQGLAAGVVFSLLVPVSIYTVIKSQAYDGNTKNPDGTTKTRTKLFVGAFVGFLILIMVGVSSLIYLSSKPAQYSVQGDTLIISGLYGEKIRLSEIEEIVLKDRLPEIQFKSNGSALGAIKKGNFSLKEIGQAKLFLDSDQPPFIFMDVGSGLRIMNTAEPEKTKELYEKLLTAREKK